MSDKRAITNFYEISQGAVDGYFWDMASFYFNDFPEWIMDKPCKFMCVNDQEANTPDLIAFLEYKDEQLYWVICLANKIMDPFAELPVGKNLAIPRLKDVDTYITLKNSSNQTSTNTANKNRVVSLN